MTDIPIVADPPSQEHPMTAASEVPEHDDLAELINEYANDPATLHAMVDGEELFRLLVTLRAMREEQGVSQKLVAGRMGTTQSAVSNIEGGATDPQITTLMRYARAVGARVCLRARVDAPTQARDAAEWASHARGGRAHRPQLRALRSAADYLPHSA